MEIPRELILAVAEKNNTSEHVVKRVLKSNFKFLRNTIHEGDDTDFSTLKSCYFLGLGTFYPVPRFFKKRNTEREKRRLRNEQE